MTQFLISTEQLDSVDRAATLLDHMHDALHGIAILCDNGNNDEAAAIAFILSDCAYRQAEPLQDAVISLQPSEQVCVPLHGKIGGE